MTSDAALGACQIILPETPASAMCIANGRQVLASWGEGCERYPTGQPVVLETTLDVIETQATSVFSRASSSSARRGSRHRLSGADGTKPPFQNGSFTES